MLNFLAIKLGRFTLLRQGISHHSDDDVNTGMQHTAEWLPYISIWLFWLSGSCHPDDMNWTRVGKMDSSLVQASQLGHIWVLQCLSQHCSHRPAFPRQWHTLYGSWGTLKEYSRPLRGGWGLSGVSKLLVLKYQFNFSINCNYHSTYNDRQTHSKCKTENRQHKRT